MRFGLRSGHKFGASKVSLDGYKFSSKLEASVYQMLKLRQASGELEILKTQSHVKLTKAEITYIPDFKCRDKSGCEFYVEAKGFETPEWRIKLRLWRHYGPAPLEIWKGSHTNPRLVEVVYPIEPQEPMTLR